MLVGGHRVEKLGNHCHIPHDISRAANWKDVSVALPGITLDENNNSYLPKTSILRILFS